MNRDQFDPEKVKRYQGFLAGQPDKSGEDMWVQEDDYDQLLQLYRSEKARAKEIIVEQGIAIKLDAEAWTKLQEALDAPPRDMPRLRAILGEPRFFKCED